VEWRTETKKRIGTDGRYANIQYSISTDKELAQLADLVNNGIDTTGMTFVLANDIDLSNYCLSNQSNGGWISIGKYVSGSNDYSHAFMGTFDGNGHIISNLSLNNNLNCQGLFGAIYKAKIINLGVENSNVSACKQSSIIAGLATESSIENCFSTGSVRATDGYAGGIVGELYRDSSLKNCYSTANIVSLGQRNGGLAGSANTNCTISNCYSTGDVKAQGERTGGLCGFVISNCTITNSFATGNVECSAIRAGGFVGISNNGVFKNCYATGNVIGTSKFGGFCGEFLYTIDITNCASTQEDSYVVELTEASIKEKYTPEYMGFNDSWEVKENKLQLKWEGKVNKLYDVDNFIDLKIAPNATNSSLIEINMSFSIDELLNLKNLFVDDEKFLNIIDDFYFNLSKKITYLGTIENKIESALEEISVQYDNLVSSRSTLRDADIAEVSSHYIQQQILQQASATLMATVNQSPSIALQLI